MDCFSFRCTNPGCCRRLAGQFPDLRVQMNPLIISTHAHNCRSPMQVQQAARVKGYICLTFESSCKSQALLLDLKEISLAPGRSPNSHAPVIWMTQVNQGRSTTCVSLISGTPSCCHNPAVCTALCAPILSDVIRNTWSALVIVLPSLSRATLGLKL